MIGTASDPRGHDDDQRRAQDRPGSVIGPYDTPAATEVLSRSRRDDVAHSNDLIERLNRLDHR